MKLRKFWALVLTATMLLTLFPTITPMVSAAESDSPITFTKTAAAHLENGVPDGTVDITMEAYTTGTVHNTETVTPTDIVLVLDVSGSMDEPAAHSPNNIEVDGVYYTYFAHIFDWDAPGYGFRGNGADFTYYIKNADDTYTEVEYEGRDDNGYEYYSAGSTNYYPELENGVATNRENNYEVRQMYRNMTHMEILKEGADAFIAETAVKNASIANAEDKHRIAIIKFGSAEYYYGNQAPEDPDYTDSVEGNNRMSNGYNYTQIVKNFTIVDDTGKTELINAMNNLQAGGATAVDYGMQLAEMVLGDRPDATGRNETVIVFTDGAPTHSSSYDSSVAGSAINKAKEFKDANIKVFSIGGADDADSTVLGDNSNQFMHYISNNFPSASYANNTITPGTGDIDAGYYMTPSDDKNLESIFVSIMDSIASPTIEMGTAAGVIDTISPYFTIPDGANDVTLQVADKTATGWATPQTAGNGITATVTGNTVTVRGFDFDENHVTTTPRGTNNDFYGRKLIITINVTPDYAAIDAAKGTLTNGVIPTNLGNAAVVNSNNEAVITQSTPTLTANKVIYKVDGEDYDTLYRFPGAEVTVAAEPTKEGHTFGGWSETGTFTMPDEDKTITGTFSKNQYTVTYIYSGVEPADATALPTQTTVYYGDTVTLAAAATATGYTFSGWSPRQDFVKIDANGQFTMPASNVTLIGSFEPGDNTRYTIEHYLEGLDGEYALEETEHEFATTGETKTASPMVFEGFTVDTTVDGTVQSGTVTADGSLILKLYYTRDKYDVIYQIDGFVPTGAPSAPATKEYKYGENVTVEDVLSLTGYVFTGWYHDLEDTDPAYIDISGGSFTMPDGDVYIAGYFTASADTAYKVEHYLENLDGTYGDGNGAATPARTENFSGTTNTEVPANEFFFEGFTFDSTIDGTVQSGIIAADGSLVLKLYYTRNRHKVYYDIDGLIPDGVTKPAAVEVAYGDDYTVLDALSAVGYDFEGWYLASDTAYANISGTTKTMPDNDVYIAGNFTAKRNTAYTVEHYLQNINDDNYTLDDSLTQDLEGVTGSEVSVNALSLTGFTLRIGDPSTQTDYIKADGSLVFKFYYDRNTYNVTYKYEGTVPADATPTDGLKQENVKYGATVTVDTTVPNGTMPQGYASFFGWYRGAALEEHKVTSFEMPARDVELLGYFVPSEATKYTVEHYLQNAENDNYTLDTSRTEELYGKTLETVTAYPLATVLGEGYTYNEGRSDHTGIIAADGSLVLKLYYDRDTYNVTYQYEYAPAGADSVPVDNTDYRHGAEVTVAAEPSAIDGYTFDGWHVHDSALIITSGTFEMPIRNVTLYGRFTPNTNTPYKVEHYLENLDGSYGDGSGNATPVRTENFTATTDTEVTANAIPFEGFTFDSTVTDTVESGTVAGDGSLVLKLYYTRNEFDVIYQIDGTTPTGVTVPSTQSYHYGEEFDVEDALETAGYVFSGWYHANDATYTDISGDTLTMPNRDVYIAGNFTHATDTAYKVEHYLENLDGTFGDGDGTEGTPARTENFTGTTNGTATANEVHFTGYTLDDTITGTVKSGTIAADGSLVLKLYYTRTPYTVTYSYTGTVPTGAPALPTGNPFTHDYKDTVTLVVVNPSDVPSGYTFHGWTSADSSLDVSGTTFEMPAKHVVLSGHFHANDNTPYKIHHYLQNLDGTYSTTPYESETRHTTTATNATVYAKKYAGYTIDLDTTTGEDVSGDYTTITKTIDGAGSTTFDFYYKRNENNVTYELDGVQPAGVTVTVPAEYASDEKYGAEVSVKPDLAQAGYTFSGWTTTDAEITNGKFTMPDKAVVLKGKFTANTDTEYKVEHYLQKLNAEGTDVAGTNKATDYALQSEDTVISEGTSGLAVTATAKHYEGFEPRVDNVTAAIVAGDGTTVIAIYYDRIVSDITYRFYGSPLGHTDAEITSYNETDVPFGATRTRQDAPHCAPEHDHQFSGWISPNVDPDAITGGYTMPANDVNFYGALRERYDVAYDLDGGTGADGVDYSTVTVLAGTVVDVKAAPTKSNYTFTGWSDGTNTYAPADTITVNADITLTAKYNYNGGGGGSGGTARYTLTYESNGGTVYLKESYVRGTVVALDKVPKKDGFIFDGWHTDANLTEDATQVTLNKNMTVYAAWLKDNGNAGTGYDTPGALNSEEHFAYVVGYPDGTVRPNANITRAEAVSIFFRLLKDDVRDENISTTNVYEDVNEGDWHNLPISTMLSLGIASGRSEAHFEPDAYITRAEFAVLCARFDDSDFEIVDTFTDVEGHWAEAEIHEAAAHGWLRGYEDNTFRPDEFITRAEAMMLINRVLNRIPETPADLLDGMIAWPDNADTDAWYYLTVQEATNDHVFEMKNNIYEKWTKLTDITDWMEYHK